MARRKKTCAHCENGSAVEMIQTDGVLTCLHCGAFVGEADVNVTAGPPYVEEPYDGSFDGDDD